MTLEERIEHLELENRSLRRMMLGAVVLFGGCLAVAVTSGVRAQTKAVPRIVEAERFVLKDAQGHVHGFLGISPHGASLSLHDGDGRPFVSLDDVGLHILDGNGNSRARISLDKNRSSISLNDGSGKADALLSVDEDGPRIAISEGEGLASLWVDAKKQAGLLLTDTKGNIVSRLWVLEDEPDLGLDDATGQERVHIGFVDHSPELSLYDANGNERANLSSSSDGVSLELSDPQGFKTSIGNTGLMTPSTGETHQTSAASIRMFNDKGNVIWAAPPQ